VAAPGRAAGVDECRFGHQAEPLDVLLDDQVYAADSTRPTAVALVSGAAHARHVGQEVGLVRGRHLEFRAVRELVLVARALQPRKRKRRSP